MCINDNISNILVDEVLRHDNFNNIYCESHPNLKTVFCFAVTHLIIFQWTKNIDRILCGQDNRLKTTSVGDFVKRMAILKATKCKKL